MLHTLLTFNFLSVDWHQSNFKYIFASLPGCNIVFKFKDHNLGQTQIVAATECGEVRSRKLCLNTSLKYNILANKGKVKTVSKI